MENSMVLMVLFSLRRHTHSPTTQFLLTLLFCIHSFRTDVVDMPTAHLHFKPFHIGGLESVQSNAAVYFTTLHKNVIWSQCHEGFMTGIQRVRSGREDCYSPSPIILYFLFKRNS